MGTRSTQLEDRTDGDLRRTLLWMIAIGGVAVLASYLVALDPVVAGKLWGGIPEGRVRDLYKLNMFLAAIGFLAATGWLAFANSASALHDRTGLGFPWMFTAYAAILFASALWLPLTALYVRQPSAPLWLLIRLVLFVVGGGASVIGLMLVRLAAHGPKTAWLAVAAFFFLWLQTMVLDALVWPHYYSNGT